MHTVYIKSLFILEYVYSSRTVHPSPSLFFTCLHWVGDAFILIVHVHSEDKRHSIPLYSICSKVSEKPGKKKNTVCFVVICKALVF